MRGKPLDGAWQAVETAGAAPGGIRPRHRRPGGPREPAGPGRQSAGDSLLGRSVQSRVPWSAPSHADRGQRVSVVIERLDGVCSFAAAGSPVDGRGFGRGPLHDQGTVIGANPAADHVHLAHLLVLAVHSVQLSTEHLVWDLRRGRISRRIGRSCHLSFSFAFVLVVRSSGLLRQDARGHRSPSGSGSALAPPWLAETHARDGERAKARRRAGSTGVRSWQERLAATCGSPRVGRRLAVQGGDPHAGGPAQVVGGCAVRAGLW